MYLSVQKIQGRSKQYGYPKGVVTYTKKIGTTTYYSWKYTDEKFERPNISFKFVIKKSYRENGKVKQLQLCLGTIFWYEFICERQDLWTDYNVQRIKDKFKPTQKQLKALHKEINKAIDKIEPEASKCWYSSSEYRKQKQYSYNVDLWQHRKEFFRLEYGDENIDKFEQIYDLFNTIHNQSLLDELKKKKAEKETKKKAEEERQEQEWENTSKWVNDEYARRFGNSTSYSDEEKTYLKQFYRTLAKNYHPDIAHDNGKAMQFLNQLKEQWGV